MEAVTYNHKIVFYSLINGVGNSTIAYQIARVLRLPFYQEQKNDLAYYLSSVLDRKKYGIKQLDSYKHDSDKALKDDSYSKGGIFDLKKPHASLFNMADAIVVLTNNSYLDILKTIAALKDIESTVVDKKKPIHVVFNRLQLGNAEREKKYTGVSKQLIKQMAPHLNIVFSYIRTSFIYYRNIEKGSFFMDHFFKWDKAFLEDFPSVKNPHHTKYLEMFFDAQYEKVSYDFEPIDDYEEVFDSLNRANSPVKVEGKPTSKRLQDINQYIAKKNFHQENIRLSQSAVRDMYSLLYKIGGIYQKEYVLNGITKFRTQIEEG